MSFFDFLKSIQNKPYSKRLMYFWTAAIMSFIFSFSLMFFSVKGLVQNVSKDNFVGGKKVDKTIKSFSAISDRFSSTFKDSKAFIYDMIDKVKQAEKIEQEQSIKNEANINSLDGEINDNSENNKDKKPNILPVE